MDGGEIREEANQIEEYKLFLWLFPVRLCFFFLCVYVQTHRKSLRHAVDDASHLAREHHRKSVKACVRLASLVLNRANTQWHESGPEVQEIQPCIQDSGSDTVTAQFARLWGILSIPLERRGERDSSAPTTCPSQTCLPPLPTKRSLAKA